MKKYFTNTLTLCCALVLGVLISTKANGQCQNDFEFGSVDASTLDNSVTNITTCNFYGDYAPVTNVEAGSNFQIDIPDDGGYITVREGTFNGPVIANGSAPLNVNNVSGDDLFIHFNGDASCSTATDCITTTIQCLSCDGCLTLSEFSTEDLSAGDNTVVPQSGCNIVNEYNVVTNPSFLETIEFTATNGAYIVVRSGTFDGPVVGEGFSPVQVTSFGEDLFSHYLSDASCGLTPLGCIETTVQCTSCPPPDPMDGDCYNGDDFGGADLSEGSNASITLANCAFSTEHSEVTGVPAGENIVFTLENGNYITVREGTPNGPVVAQGFSPVTVFSASGANLYAHYTANALCESDGLCYNSTVQCASCPDCPEIGLDIGDSCDDEDPTTGNDIVLEGCICEGQPVPTNNEPCNAININCGSSISGSTLTANQSGISSPSCSPSGSEEDVFYSIFALPGITYEVTVNGVDYDGVLVAYTGACDGSLTELDCSDDGLSPNIAETISFTVTEPQSVLVRTYDWNSNGGSFNLSVSCALPNTTCADAVPITFGGDPVYGNNTGAGPSGPNMDCAFAGDGLQNVVWYTFFAPVNGSLIVELTSEFGVTTFVDQQIQILDACDGEVIACNEDQLSSLHPRIELQCGEFEQGAQYFLQVDGFNGLTGTFKIETSSESCTPPPNDLCSEAAPIAVNLPGQCPGNAIQGTTLGSNNEGEFSVSCEPDNPDVFYSFNSGSFSSFNLGVLGVEATDLVIGVYEECSGEPITCTLNPIEPVLLELDTDTDYIIRVSTNIGFGVPGTFNICLQGVYDCPDLSANIGDACNDGNPNTINDAISADCECVGETLPVPENDLCSNASNLDVNLPGQCPGNAVEGTTLGSSNEGVVTGCEPENQDVFYSFNTGSFNTISIGLIAGTATDIGFSLLESCTGEEIDCLFNQTGPFNVSLTPQTDYILRINTNTDFGNPGTFQICLQGVYDCPALEANIGDACDDGDPNTIDDTVITGCSCEGTPVNGALSVTSGVLCADTYTLELYDPGTANLVTSVSGSVNPDGSFTATGLPAGTYDLFIKMNKHLKKGFANISISSGSTSLNAGAFIPGDLNDDNEIGIQDFGAFSAAYGTEAGEPGFNPAGDFNCDDQINIVDFSAFSTNFGTDGEEPPIF